MINSTYGWVARVNASEMHGAHCCVAHAGFTKSSRIIQQMSFVLSTSTSVGLPRAIYAYNIQIDGVKPL